MSLDPNGPSKKPSRIPKLKVNGCNVPPAVSSARTSNIPHVPFNAPHYKRISVTRSVFEGKKLTSACDFLRELKRKLEQNAGEFTGEFCRSEFGNLDVSDVLESFFHVSNNLSPIVCPSESKAEIYSPRSIVPEKHFDDVMLSVEKLTEVLKRATRDNSYDTLYYHKNFTANNVETFAVFRSSTLNAYEGKIYIDRALLKQLEELYRVLNDVTTKLKHVEENWRGIEGQKQTKIAKESDAAQEDREVVESVKTPRKRTMWDNRIEAEIASNDGLDVCEGNLKTGAIPEGKSGVNVESTSRCVCTSFDVNFSRLLFVCSFARE